VRLLLCLPLLLGTLLSAEPASQVTLLMQFEGEPSPASLFALGRELKSILAASDLPIHVQLRARPLTESVSGQLVVFKMKGSCNLNSLPIAALSDERGPLAMTHRVDGEMQPFAEIECDRVRRSLERTLGHADPQMHEVQYGVALARVMAHELYHMLGRSTAHTATGITKERLSSLELTRGRLLLSPDASAALATKP
jgi:hypothetical protein